MPMMPKTDPTPECFMVLPSIDALNAKGPDGWTPLEQLLWASPLTLEQNAAAIEEAVGEAYRRASQQCTSGADERAILSLPTRVRVSDGGEGGFHRTQHPTTIPTAR